MSARARDAGRLIRVPVDQVRVTARQSMGVTLFRLSDGEVVASIFPVLEDEVADEIAPGDEAVAEGPSTSAGEAGEDADG